MKFQQVPGQVPIQQIPVQQVPVQQHMPTHQVPIQQGGHGHEHSQPILNAANIVHEKACVIHGFKIINIIDFKFIIIKKHFAVILQSTWKFQ